MSLKDDILAADDLPIVEVPVPEWPKVGVVRVRTLSGTEKDAFEAESLERKGKRREVNLQNFRARLCSMCVVDADGNRVFTDAEAVALGKKSSKALGRIADAATKLNGLSEEDVDELVKN